MHLPTWRTAFRIVVGNTTHEGAETPPLARDGDLRQPESAYLGLWTGVGGLHGDSGPYTIIPADSTAWLAGMDWRAWNAVAVAEGPVRAMEISPGWLKLLSLTNLFQARRP